MFPFLTFRLCLAVRLQMICFDWRNDPPPNRTHTCTAEHKHSTVADNFGVGVYAIFLFFLTILWSLVWGDATACPYTHMEDLLEGKASIRSVLLKTWAQLIGGCCVYRFVQIFWWFEFAHTHEGRAFAPCTTDLQVNYRSLGRWIFGEISGFILRGCCSMWIDAANVGCGWGAVKAQ